MKINWMDEKDFLENLINDNIPYEVIGCKYNVTENTIKKVAKRLGIILKHKRSINPN